MSCECDLQQWLVQIAAQWICGTEVVPRCTDIIALNSSLWFPLGTTSLIAFPMSNFKWQRIEGPRPPLILFFVFFFVFFRDQVPSFYSSSVLTWTISNSHVWVSKKALTAEAMGISCCPWRCRFSPYVAAMKNLRHGPLLVSVLPCPWLWAKVGWLSLSVWTQTLCTGE